MSMSNVFVPNHLNHHRYNKMMASTFKFSVCYITRMPTLDNEGCSSIFMRL
ncbi:30S ribosomal protein S17 [Candidatus Hodgkinia cicadicola]|nr:30S ribosomal protein S17 [Candidatus Hodgkinia cicadicola]